MTLDATLEARTTTLFDFWTHKREKVTDIFIELGRKTLIITVM